MSELARRQSGGVGGLAIDYFRLTNDYLGNR